MADDTWRHTCLNVDEQLNANSETLSLVMGGKHVLRELTFRTDSASVPFFFWFITLEPIVE